MAYKKRRGRHHQKKRKRTFWDESMIVHRYDGKMIYNFRYDFLEPLFLILKWGIIIALVFLVVYYLF
jgi:hypothetical protein